MMASLDMLMSALLDYTTRTITSSSGGGDGGGIGVTSCEVLFVHVNALLNASLRLRAHVKFRSVIRIFRQPTQVNLILTPIPHAPLFPRLFMPTSASAPRLPAPPTITVHQYHLPLPLCSFLHTSVPEFSSSTCGVIRPQGHAC
jgi:hypothetical protein